MRARLVVALVVMWLGGYNSYAQDTLWTRAYGGSQYERCYGMEPTEDGGYILAGYQSHYQNYADNGWLLKTNSVGDSLWSRTFGGSGFSCFWAVHQTDDGGYILAGYYDVSVEDSTDFWLLKTDANGDSLWSRHYGGHGADQCASAQVTSDGGYILAGYTMSFGSGDADVWLLKVSAEGDSLWSRTFGGPARDLCYKVRQTSDGGFILAGNTDSYGAGSTDFWMIKTNEDGDSLWSRTFGLTGPDECHSIQQTSDGGYILVGVGSSSGIRPWLVKTDANGDSLWSRTVPLRVYGVCHDVLQLTDGGYLLGGYYLNNTWSRFLAMQRTDSNGDTLWTRHYTHAGSYTAFWSVHQATDGGYVLAGYNFNNAVLWKLAPDPVSAEQRPVKVANEFALHPAFPNPFNATTRLSFSLPHTAPVSLKIYDVQGREVAVLVNETRDAGTHDIVVNGSSLSSGIYFARLNTDGNSRTQKMVLLK
jgi:hypothetical protein